MKALTICQPYAELIMLGEKRVENRTWPTSYRGPLATHAGLSRDWLRTYWPLPDRMDFGAIVGTVDLIDCGAREEIIGRYKWARGHAHVEGPYCFVLAHVRRLPAPIPYHGRQGFFDVPDELFQNHESERNVTMSTAATEPMQEETPVALAPDPAAGESPADGDGQALSEPEAAPDPADDEAERGLQLEHYAEIRAMEVKVAELEIDMTEKAEVHKAAKKRFEAADAELRSLIRRGPNRPVKPDPQLQLFGEHDAPQDDSWREVDIDQLNISERHTILLREAGVETIGQLEDLRASADGLQGIKGIGDVAAGSIEDAVIDWLTENRDAEALEEARADGDADGDGGEEADGDGDDS